MKIGILNTTICTGGEGAYELKSITNEEARALVIEKGYTSYVGHVASATLISTLLGISVEMNRNRFNHEFDQVAICFKLNIRLEEGKILTIEEIKKIGFQWFQMSFSPLN